MKSIGLRLLK